MVQSKGKWSEELKNAKMKSEKPKSEENTDSPLDQTSGEEFITQNNGTSDGKKKAQKGKVKPDKALVDPVSVQTPLEDEEEEGKVEKKRKPKKESMAKPEKALVDGPTVDEAPIDKVTEEKKSKPEKVSHDVPNKGKKKEGTDNEDNKPHKGKKKGHEIEGLEEELTQQNDNTPEAQIIMQSNTQMIEMEVKTERDENEQEDQIASVPNKGFRSSPPKQTDTADLVSESTVEELPISSYNQQIGTGMKLASIIAFSIGVLNIA